MKMIRQAVWFIGPRGALWLTLSVISGLVLASAEIALSFWLTLLLGILGISDQQPQLPYGIEAKNISVTALMGILVATSLIRGFSAWLGGQSAQVANDVISLRLRLLLFYEVFNLRTGFASISEINTKINETFGKAAAFCCQATQAVPTIVLILFLFVFLTKQSILQTGLGICGIAIIALVLFRLNGSIRKLAKRIPEEHAALSIRTTRTVRNWLLLKALRTMPREYRLICESTKAYSAHSIRASSFIVASSVVPQMLGTVVVASMITLHLAHPQMPNLSFVAFLYLYMRFVQALSGLAGYHGSMSLYFPQFREAAAYFFSFNPKVVLAATADPEVTGATRSVAKEAATTSKLKAAGSPPSVSFRNVSFRYPGQTDAALVNSTFHIAPGDQLAIEGRSGTGKSTILALAMGVLKPSAGTIEIDGERPDKYFDRPDSRIGYVGPEPFLVEGSIKENLLYGIQAERSDEDLIQALQLAQLGKWIEGQSEGLSYVLSENGEGLSSGQKQRLSLARAFLLKPTLLLLDEISANLDSATEEEIANVLLRFRGICTVLIVSHREGLIKNISNRIRLGMKS